MANHRRIQETKNRATLEVSQGWIRAVCQDRAVVRDAAKQKKRNKKKGKKKPKAS